MQGTSYNQFSARSKENKSLRRAKDDQGAAVKLLITTKVNRESGIVPPGYLRLNYPASYIGMHFGEFRNWRLEQGTQEILAGIFLTNLF